MAVPGINATSNSTSGPPLASTMDSGSNAPEEEMAAVMERLKICNYVIVALAFLIGVVAILGNSCVVYLVASKRRMRNVTNYFIASLAVSDIMIAVICIPFSFVANVLFNYWPFGSALCPVLPYFQVAVVFQNAYTLLAMSLERYVAIVHPFLRRLGKSRCLQIVVLCWILAFLTPIPSAVTSKLNFVTESPNSTNGAWICFEVWASDNQRVAYTITIMVIQFFLPVMVLVYTYAKIVHVIWLKDMPALGELLTQNKEQKEVVKVKEADPRKKIIKMMITVVGIYILCWLPLHLLTIATDSDTSLFDWPYMQITWNSLQLVALSSCVYNPFIYWWMNPKFKEGYQMLFKRIKYKITCQEMDDDFLDMGTSVGNSKRFYSTRYSTTNGVRRLSNSTQMEYSSCDGGGTSVEKLLMKEQQHHPTIKETEFSPQLGKIPETLENGNSRQ